MGVEGDLCVRGVKELGVGELSEVRLKEGIPAGSD